MCWNPVVLLIAAGLGSGFGNLTAHMSPLEEEEEDNNTNKEEEEEVVSAILAAHMSSLTLSAVCIFETFGKHSSKIRSNFK